MTEENPIGVSQIVETAAAEAADPPSAPSRFRPDIEGLRAVAVVAVLAFHAGVPGFAGGFVGVDVFFVISGFLITGQMLRDVDGTGLRFREFYARRARRLLPAATLVIVATLVGSALFLSPLQQASTGADSRAATLFYANMRFAGEATDYFAQGSAPSPFQHFWSLSVEEQFYLVWPAIVLLALVGAGRTAAAHRRRLGVVLAGLVVVSFIGCVWLTSYSQPWAFYWLAPRAWELAIGALLAVGIGRIARIDHPLKPVAGWVGMAAVVGSVVLLSDKVQWPGALAAIPVLGTALVIAAGIGAPGAALGRVLSLGPFQAVGRYSYSLYLWHWPALILAASVFPTVATNWVKAVGVLAVAAVPAALVSYHLVENPVRHASAFRPARAALTLGAVLIVTSLAASLLYGAVTVGGTLDAGRPAPVSGAAIGSGIPVTDFVPSDLTPALAELDEGAGNDDGPPGCRPANAGEATLTCILGDGDAAPSIFLFGDSHSAMWSSAFEEYADRNDIRVRRLTAGGCGSLSSPPTGGSTRNCDSWRAGAFELIEREQPDLVVLSNQSYKGYRRDAAEWEAGLRTSIERISPSSRVVVLGETPWSEDDIPDCLARNLENTRPCEPNANRAELGRISEVEQRVAAETGAGWIDTASWLCTEDRCPAIIGNILAYRDQDHLSRQLVLSRIDLLSAALDEQLAAAEGS